MLIRLSPKIIAIGLALGLGALLILYVIFSSEVSLISPQKPERLIEVKDTHIAGWSEGKKTWELYAQEGWTSRNQDATNFEKVSQGVIYENGKTIVRAMKAERVKMYKWSKMVEAFGGPENQPGTLEAEVDFNALGPPACLSADMAGRAGSNAGRRLSTFGSFSSGRHEGP
jgi:hypothetical protein